VLRASEPDTLRILVLGPLVVEHDNAKIHVAGSHRRRLLAFLLTRSGQVAGADAIAEALWGDDLPSTAIKSIHNHVARLRGSFASVDRDLIETTPGGYRLVVDPETIDAVVFERLAGEGRQRLACGDAAGAVSVLDDALALWRGDAYGEFGDAGFAVGEVARLTELKWAAMEDFAEARLEGGSFEVVTADVERVVVEQPGRERAWGC